MDEVFDHFLAAADAEDGSRVDHFVDANGAVVAGIHFLFDGVYLAVDFLEFVFELFDLSGHVF